MVVPKFVPSFLITGGALTRTGQKYEWPVHFFFYFVACPIFPPKNCRLSSFEQKVFSLYQQKMFVKTSILVALAYYTDKVQLQNKFQF